MISPILYAGYTQMGVSVCTVHISGAFFEGPALMGAFPGVVSHNAEETVFVDGGPGIKQGHDVGYCIPHVAVPMTPLCAINTLLSSHKVQYPVSRVMLKDAPAGTYWGFLMGQICCDPVNLPTGVLMLLKCTVWTTVSVLDFVKGVGYIVIDIIFGYLIGKLGGIIGKKLAAKLVASKIFLSLAKRLSGLSLGKQIFAEGGKSFTKNVLNQLPGETAKHIVNGWGIGPLMSGLPRGKMGVGYGSFSVTFFDEKWW